MTTATVWFLSELYYPEQTSTGYFLTGLAEGLSSSFRIGVLCAQPSYGARGTKAPGRERRHGVEIIRCASTVMNKNILPFRLANAVSFALSATVTAFRRVRRGDVVVTVTNPPLLPPLMALVSKVRGAQLVVLVHDVYPDVLVVSGVARERSPMVRALERLYRWTYTRARSVIVLGEDMRSRLRDRAPGDKLNVIGNWGDVEGVAPSDRGAGGILRELGIADAFVVQYLGNMGWTHDLDVLLEAAGQVQGEAEFLFIGSGRQHAALAAVAREKKLANVHVLPPCTQDQLGDYLNACDLAVIAMRSGMSGVSVPSRVYNILAAGKPLLAICDPDSELAGIVRRHGCGWVVEPGNAFGAVETIREARSSPARLTEMGVAARRAAVQCYTRRHAVAAYENLLRRLLHSSESSERRALTA